MATPDFDFETIQDDDTRIAVERCYEAMKFARHILLHNRIQDFTSEDVVAVYKTILEQRDKR